MRHYYHDSVGSRKLVVGWRYYGVFLCVHSDGFRRVSFSRFPPPPVHIPPVESLHLHYAFRLNVHGTIYGNAGMESRGIQYIGDSKRHGLPQCSLFARTWNGRYQRALLELGSPFGSVDPSWGSMVRF